MKTLKDILNEDSAAEIQADETPNNGDSGTLIPLKAGKFNKRSLIRTMRKPEGVIQTIDGNQFTIYHPIDQSDIWHDKSVFATDKDGGEVEVNYDDITSYSETYDENDAAAVRSMTYDGMEMPKTKIGILTAMKRELRSMKVADIKASYQYIKAAHCNTKEGMQGIGTKKDMLTAMMKDLRGMKKDALMASYGYIKAAHCGPQEGAHEDEMVNASSCTSESADLSEAIDFSKVPDDQLIAWLTRFRTVLTKAGLPLKVDRYVKGNPWSDFKKDFANAEKEADKRGLRVEGVELDEAIDFSKLTDEGLLSWIPWARYQTKTKTPVQLSKQTNTGDFKKDLSNAEKEAKKRGLKVEGVELEEATELYKKGKISFTRFSYGTGKGAGLQINNGMNFIQFREEDIKVLMNGLKAITQSNGLLKKEEVSLDEMKTKDDDLAVMIYDFIGADTEGLPLKTLIHQAVGKYFGSQKDKKKAKDVTEATKIQKPFDASSELMRVVNSLDQRKLNSLWDYKIVDKKRPVDVEGAMFPLYKEAVLKIFNVRGEDPFTDEQKKYLLDMYKKAQKGAGFGVGRKWSKMEFSRDGMEATAKIIVRSKEILDKNQY